MPHRVRNRSKLHLRLSFHPYEMNSLYPWQNELWQRWQYLRLRLPHALLLKGPRGTGKLDFALHIAQSMLCEAPTNGGQGCGNCPSCHWFELGTHPDFRLLQPDSLAETDEDEERSAGKKKPPRLISVEQVRSLADFANLSAHQGKYRVVVIHPAEAMNSSAANALLKTLEEPTPGMLMLLVSDRPQRLLPTIMSRCLSLAAPLPPRDASTAWLKEQGIDDPALALSQSGFAPLQAQRWLVEDSGREEHELLRRAIKDPSRLDAYALAEQLQKVELPNFIHWMQQWCYDLLSNKLTNHTRYSTEYNDSLNKISFEFETVRLLQYQKELLVAQREAMHTLNPKMFLESVLLSYKHALQQA